MDFLKAFTKKHGQRFLDRTNIDLHSCGGFSVEGWLEAEVCLKLYRYADFSSVEGMQD